MRQRFSSLSAALACALLLAPTHVSAQETEEPDPPPERARDDDAPLILYGEGVGTYQARVNFVSELPLSPIIPDPTGESDTDELGQELFMDQWFRIRLEFGIRDRIRLVGETDAFDGLVVGQFSRGVEAADRAREAPTAFPGIRPRALYLEWTPEELELQAGLTPVHWGLGIVDNDGAHAPLFGDYRYGDLMTRVAATFQPLGASSPLHLAGAGDLVFEDQLADIRDGDLAWRGVLAAMYREEERRLGIYGAYRNQRSEVDRGLRTFVDRLEALTVDAFARWDFDDPSGGTITAALEAAYTYLAIDFDTPEVADLRSQDQLLLVAQVGHTSTHADVLLELGFASGGETDRAVMHPDHHIGLILFPEVIAWQSARAATLYELEEGRVHPGTPLSPTNGGVSNAVYLHPVLTVRLSDMLRARVGAVWARALTDVVDPYRAAQGTRANYRGGDATNRDLGLELDAQLHAEGEIARGIVLSGGLEAGWFLPGHAFDDASGDTMDPLGLFRVRTGLTF